VLVTQQAGRFFKAVAAGSAMLAATFVVKEITDQLQREGVREEHVQPRTRMARHLREVGMLGGLSDLLWRRAFLV
jgi:hypothetical protein